MTTHKDTAMLEQLARTLEPRAWAALDFGDTLAFKNRRTSSLRKARAILNELKHPSEGMVRAASLAFLEWEEDRSRKDGFERPMLTAAIDFVLNEGEGNTTS